ncbi:MAG: DUF2752 domain-containing protein [Rikenellaceae bacterium]
MSLKRILLGAMVALAIIALSFFVYLYWKVSPSETALFPKCPTLMYLGFECPGCGSQRAIHHLLNGEMLEAMRMNFLLVISIPYIFIWGIFKVYFYMVSEPSGVMLAWRRRLFSTVAIKIIFTLVVLFCIVRNFVDFI